MRKNKILGYSIIIMLFVLGLFCLSNCKVYAAENYTQDYNGYSASYSNYVENKTEDTSKLGTVDVTITLNKKISSNSSIPNNWTKVNDTTLKSTRSQAEFSNFTLTMEDNTKANVVIMTPFEIEKGERIKDITLNKYFSSAPSDVSFNITSDNSNVLKVTQASGNYTIEAVGKGSATLTGTVGSKGDFLGGELTTRGFVSEKEENKTSEKEENNKDDNTNKSGLTGWKTYEPEKIELREGKSTSFVIYITNTTDNNSNLDTSFTVDWEIKDNKIAKYTNTKEQEKITNGMYAVDRVNVEGIKAGKTTLVATIKQVGNEKESIKVEYPITVYGKNENFIIGWDFSLNKKELNMKKGESDELIIMASTEYILPQVQVKDAWDVVYKVEDESIAKYTAETGLETTSGSGAAGKVKIEGLKAGTTKLLITINRKSENDTESVSFEVPITITDSNVKKDDTDKDNNNEEGNKQDKETKQDEGNKQDKPAKDVKDDTQSDKPIIQAGGDYMIVALIVIGVAVCIISIRKMKKTM